MRFDSTPQSIASQFQAASLELQSRLRAGERNVAESILSSYPALADDEDSSVELIYREYVELEELGMAPPVEQWWGRFPKHAARLQRLLRMHALLDDMDEDAAWSEGGADEKDVATLTGSRALDERTESEETPSIRIVDTLDRANSKDTQQTRGIHPDHLTTSPSASECHRIGPYEIVGEIARGGMGVVYRARDPRLDRELAIKVLSSKRRDDQARLRDEARSAAKLRHPHVVQIYDVGEHGEPPAPYIAMEYLSDGSLEHLLTAGPMGFRDAAHCLVVVAEAIDYAHQQGVVHRDVKPGNVLLDGETYKVADFGLALRRETAEATGDSSEASLQGTPAYMAPEQAIGKLDNIGPHTDVYGLGALLYELLTGQPPYHGASAAQVLEWAVWRDPTRPRALRTDIPKDLETICLTAMAKSPEKRYASAGAMAADLRRFLDFLPIEARRASMGERVARWCARRPAVAAMTFLLLAVLLVGGWVWRRHAEKLDALSDTANEAQADAKERLRQASNAIERLSELSGDMHHRPQMGLEAKQMAEEVVRRYSELLARPDQDATVRKQAAVALDRAGYLQLVVGDFEQAAATLSKSVQLFRDLAVGQGGREVSGALINLGHAQRSLGDLEQSIQAYGEAIQLMRVACKREPTDVHCALRLANAMLNQSVVLRSQQRHASASERLCEAIAIQANLVYARLGLDSEVAVPLEAETAIQACQNMRETAKRGDQRVMLSLARDHVFTEIALSIDELSGTIRHQVSRQRDGDPTLADLALNEALALRELACSLAPKEPWRWSLLARSLAQVGDQQLARNDLASAESTHRRAAETLTRLASEFPHRIEYGIQHASAHHALGKAIQRQRTRDREACDALRTAADLYDDLRSRHPSLDELTDSYAATCLRLASLLDRMGEHRESLDATRSAYVAAPSSAEASNHFAWLLVMSPDPELWDPPLALAPASTAVREKPGKADYWNTAGVVRYRCGDYEGAAEALTRAMELRRHVDPHDAFPRAMCHARLGEWQEMQRWLAAAEECLRARHSALPLHSDLARLRDEAESICRLPPLEAAAQKQ